MVLGGRTGGLNENQDVDNITISTIISDLVVAGLTATGLPSGVSIPFYDSGGGVVNPANCNAQVSIDGGPFVPASSVSKNGKTSTVWYYSYPTLFTPGSVHTVVASIQDTRGNTTTSSSLSFTVAAYSVVNSAWMVTSGVNTSAVGFRAKPYQSGIEPNNVWWADEQIEGLQGPCNSLVETGLETDAGYIDYTGLINLNYTNCLGVMNENGNFQASNGYQETQFPGIVTDPTCATNIDNTAEEFLCFLQFPAAGVYTMGVNSDDGFDLTTGPNPTDWGALSLGAFGLGGTPSYDQGRGSSDTIFSFVVTNASGFYPFRLLWENGTGGANCEWYVVQDGVKILLNDPSPTNTTGI